MAFDVYVGTMTRFYRREWENVAQQAARQEGFTYRMIYADGEPEPPPPADHVRQAVAGWSQALSGGLQPHGFGPVEWDEGDDRPYFTDRPAWEGYTGLLVWAAHTEHPDLPLPTELPESWIEDPAYQRSTVHEFKSRYRSILEPQLWLPTEFPFVFNAPTLVSEEPSCLGSVFTLKKQLDELHEQTATKLAECKRNHPAPKLSSKDSEPPKSGLAESAEFGLAIFRELAGKACEHRLPILLHF